MRRVRAFALSCAIVVMAAPAQPQAALPPVLQVLGSVNTAAHPVANVLIIALNLGNLEASQTFSASDGSFSLPQLPAGVYKVIAMKYGFAPAMAMVVPTRREHRLKLSLDVEKAGRTSTSQEMWEIRGSVPPDILREIDQVMMAPQLALSTPAYDAPRFKGEMMSMTGVASQTTSPTFAQSALGVQSRLGENWQLGFRGNLHRVDDPTDDARFGASMAESSAMQMELRSSSTESYRLASTKSWWRYRDDVPLDQQEADIRSHNFEWEHGGNKLQVRYLAQQNLFAATPGSNLIEVAGNTTVLQTLHSDVGVALRVTQESLRHTANGIYRTADLTANAKLELIPAFTVSYGMSSRLGLYGTEWAPRTGFAWKLAKDTSLVASGLYKVYDQERPNMLPSVVVWSDDSHLLPRYSYSFGFVSGDQTHDHFSAIASVSATDSPLRVVFSEGSEHFWDGLFIDSGDVRRDLRVTVRKEIGRWLLVDVVSSAGVATPRAQTLLNTQKIYVTSDVESTFFPTRTTLAVSYRQMQQPQPAGSGPSYQTRRVDVRLAQSLHLPVDLKVLLGLELGRATNSPVLLDAFDPVNGTRKYIGGVAVNF